MEVVFDASVYVQRRNKLKSTIGSGQLLLIGNQESSINFKDNWYHFRQDSTFLYYAGINKPNIHLLIDIDNNKEVLYADELTIDDIVWTGPLPTNQELASQVGITKIKPAADLAKDIRAQALYLPPYRPEHSILISDLLGIDIQQAAQSFSLSFVQAVINQRNIKEEREIKEMSLAVNHSYDMHNAVMKAARSGMYESDLVGIASAVAHHHQVPFSYPAIMTKRGEVLHNHDHSGFLSDGDIVLYDGGCESRSGYAGDITRTFPIGGKWQPLQRDLYDIVHKSYADSVSALQPDTFFKDIHMLACKTLVEGLIDIGFMKGDPDDAVANGAHTMFFQCGLGHMIGLDVHDMENLGEHLVGYSEEIEKSKEFGLKSLRLGRRLKSGYTVTVEPGIYIIPALIELRKSEGLYKDFINYDFLEKHASFGGIRLEDNFLITDNGSTLLGAENIAPRTSQEVEDYMNQVV